MKSPTELAKQLTRQWQNNRLRAQRLLTPEPWPLKLAIGKPTSTQVLQQAASVQQHIQRWRQVAVGQVVFEHKNYRRFAEAVELPSCWQINSPSEWVQACQDATVRDEFAVLSQLISASDSCMHELLVRERSLWRHKPLNELLATLTLAGKLTPGCAQGQPLRLLSGYGVDTKFVERHQTLLRRLLDTRFAEAASEQGLLNFLDALDENDHWLLVRPLAEGLLPFQRLRLASTELAQTALPATRILLVENERCEHLLPPLQDCIAVLGAGFNLTWLVGQALEGKQLYYWGDLDTWGLAMLARARQLRPSLQAVMMRQEVFTDYADFAVHEPQRAGRFDLSSLMPSEQKLFKHLQQQEKSRLEQEFIPLERVHTEIAEQIT